MKKEEAIKILRDVHDKALFSVRNALETIIPELAESDGEKIRKGLLAVFQKMDGWWNGMLVSGIIAWLEKQKEQKPVGDGTRAKIVSRTTSEKQVVLVSESDGNAEIGWDTRSLEDAKNLLEYGISFINKQLGVKPAEWSEEDEKMREHIISDLREFRDCETDEELVSDYEDEIAWLKSLRPSWKPSEEQMDALHYVKQFDYGGHKAALVSLYEQLEKL